MTKWKDATSYSRGATDRTPRVWELDLGMLQITVHRLHGCDGWFVSCRQLRYVDRHELDANDADSAKCAGLEYVRATVNKMAQVLKEAQP